jgi:hypothetical protein
MSLDPHRLLRGALSGGAAAGIWLLQQPLDRRIFAVDSDDARLLGRFAGRGPGAGTLLHLGNGAVFGALYAAAAPRLPVWPPLRGPLVALAEHLGSWPAIVLVEPELGGSPRAFAQATWRHLLFGTVLGELERRLNPPPLEPVSDAAVASNGHGTAAHLVASGS